MARSLVGQATGPAPGPRRSVRDRRVALIAEDHRNRAFMVEDEGEGGWGLDAVWADDSHHKVRVVLAGDNEGYSSDSSGSMTDPAPILDRGWHCTGQDSEFLGQHRGTDPAGIPPRRFVICLQNHDPIGNRALEGRSGGPCQLLLTTEDPRLAPDPAPPRVERAGAAPVFPCARPAAVLLRAWPNS